MGINRKKFTPFNRMGSKKFKSNFKKSKSNKAAKAWFKFWVGFKTMSLEEKQKVIITLFVLAMKV